jgi:hypothetical protein
MRDIEATLLVCAQQCALDDDDEVSVECAALVLDAAGAQVSCWLLIETMPWLSCLMDFTRLLHSSSVLNGPDHCWVANGSRARCHLTSSPCMVVNPDTDCAWFVVSCMRLATSGCERICVRVCAGQPGLHPRLSAAGAAAALPTCHSCQQAGC